MLCTASCVSNLLFWFMIVEMFFLSPFKSLYIRDVCMHAGDSRRLILLRNKGLLLLNVKKGCLINKHRHRIGSLMYKNGWIYKFIGTFFWSWLSKNPFFETP